MPRLEINGIIPVTILKGGKIVDGTGAPPFSGEVVIAGARIASAESSETPRPANSTNVEYEAIDCTGCIIAPGFIDVHSHSDLQVLENRTEKLLQGVTAEVVESGPRRAGIAW
jgi:N-acyl-D-amino-acid deacylase